MMKSPILLIGILVLLVSAIVFLFGLNPNKENFTDNNDGTDNSTGDDASNGTDNSTGDSKIHAFLNTWHLTNEELSKIFTADDTKVKTDKALYFNNKATIVRGSDNIDSNDLGLYSQNNGHWMRFVTNNAPIKFFTDGISGQRHGKNVSATIQNGELRTEKGLVIGRNNPLPDANHQGTWRKVNDNDSHLVGYGPNGQRKITVYDELNVDKKLCIKGTCINEEHLKALNGTKDIKFKWGGENAYLAKDGNDARVNGGKQGSWRMTY